MADYRQRKQNPIEYRDLLIEDIILGSASFDQTEITIVTNEIIIKNIYVPYNPIHNKLSSRNTPLKDKMEVFWEEVLQSLDGYKDAPPYVGFRSLL
mgnify:CR=1 FL=1|jgi:hypothetical protein